MDVHAFGRFRSVRDFFYAEEVPYGLAMIRVLLPLVLLCVVLPRWFHARELFSADGAAAQLAINYGYHDFLPEPSGTAAVALMSALAFCLAAVSVGWHTRLALFATWAIYTYLNMLDCLSTMTKYSVIASHILLLLSVSSCGAVWSVDQWRARKNQVGEAARGIARSAIWPRRLVQLLISVIYFGAAFTKLHTGGFMSGDQIRYWLLTDLNDSNPLGEHLALYPALIVAMSHIALIWQILFPVLTWRGPWRMVMLGIGMLFHLSTIWLLGLFIFPPLMIVTYFAWLNEDDVAWCRRILTRLTNSSVMIQWRTFVGIPRAAGQRFAAVTTAMPVPSALVFILSLSAAVVGGIEAEHRLDPYGVRRVDGPHRLVPMSDERVALLFDDPEQMRHSDKFFSLEVGREMLGGVVVSRGSQYAPGDRVIAQCTLVPPHEDLWVECALTDADDRVLQRFGQPVLRDEPRVSFEFVLPRSPESAGYRFVISCDSEAMLSRNVQVKSSSGVVLSN